MSREQYAIALGEIGTPIDPEEVVVVGGGVDAACTLARERAADDGTPCRVVRIVEIAYFPNPRIGS